VEHCSEVFVAHSVVPITNEARNSEGNSGLIDTPCRHVVARIRISSHCDRCHGLLGSALRFRSPSSCGDANFRRSSFRVDNSTFKAAIPFSANSGIAACEGNVERAIGDCLACLGCSVINLDVWTIAQPRRI
jgi:hypothetical protein